MHGRHESKILRAWLNKSAKLVADSRKSNSLINYGFEKRWCRQSKGQIILMKPAPPTSEGRDAMPGFAEERPNLRADNALAQRAKGKSTTPL